MKARCSRSGIGQWLWVCACWGLIPVHAGTIVVNTLLDGGLGSLRDALTIASPGDTVTFSVTGLIALTNGELRVARELSIQGPGADLLFVSAREASRCFLIDSNASVTISGLTLRDGRAEDGALGVEGEPGGSGQAGGGIYNLGTLTLSNCIVAANRAGNGATGGQGAAGGAGGGGGGIYNDGTLTLVSCMLSNNAGGCGGSGGSARERTSGNAGGPGGDGGAICNSGHLTVQTTLLSSNSAGFGGSGSRGYSPPADPTTSGSGWPGGAGGRGGCGGAIYSSGALTLRSSSIISNRSGSGGVGGNGGAGWRFGDGAAGARAGNGGSGGGLENAGGLTLDNSVFSGNSCGPGGRGGDGGAAGYMGYPGVGGVGGSGGDGGAIHSLLAGALAGCTLGLNSAGNGGLGGIAGMPSPPYPAFPGSGGNGGGFFGPSELTNCTVSQNAAGNGFGGGQGGGCAGGLTLRSCTVVSNATGGPLPEAPALAAPADGGGVAGPARLLNTIVAGNTDYCGDADPNRFPDVSGLLTSLGHNFIGVADGGSGFGGTDLLGSGAAPRNPQLGPLTNNGGGVLTHMPRPGSPAINAGDNQGAPWTDQRGAPRILCINIDIGAVESEMCHQILDIKFSQSGSILRCAGLVGTNYALEVSENLAVWTDFTQLQAGADSLMYYDDWEATNHSQRFYRLRWP